MAGRLGDCKEQSVGYNPSSIYREDRTGVDIGAMLWIRTQQASYYDSCGDIS